MRLYSKRKLLKLVIFYCSNVKRATNCVFSGLVALALLVGSIKLPMVLTFCKGTKIMKVVNFKKAVACLLVSGLAVFGSSNAFAADTQLDAPVVILETLAFGETLPMDFGTIEAPVNEEVTVVVSEVNGGRQASTATIVGTDGEEGSTVITGVSGKTLAMDGFGTCDDPDNLSIGDFKFTSSELVNGTATITHGATLVVLDDANGGNAVPTGQSNCNYTITAAY